MNLPSQQKQTHRRRDQTCGCQVGGEEEAGWTGCDGLRRSVAESIYRQPRSGASAERSNPTSKRHFRSAIKVVQSAYLRLLIFLLIVLIQAYSSFSLTFHMMCVAHKLNKGDNIQPWCTPLSVCNQSVVPCPVRTVASWPAYRFLRKLWVHLSKFVKCTKARVNPSVNYGLRVTKECQCSLSVVTNVRTNTRG